MRQQASGSRNVNEQQPDDRLLTSALRVVAAEDRAHGAAAAVEARLLAEVRSVARGSRIRARMLMVAAAAMLFLAIALPLWQATGRQAPLTDPGHQAGGLEINGRELATEFFPLTYSSVPASGAQVVRMQVPRSALTRFGVASFVVADDRSATVVAEVVVGNDGLARAVRFVRAARNDELQEQKQ
jgi:hypothetical protein